MAKEQGLSLKPAKISGTCGRLMCCLKYEQDAYEDLLRFTPKVGARVTTPRRERNGHRNRQPADRSDEVRLDDNDGTVKIFDRSRLELNFERCSHQTKRKYPFKPKLTSSRFAFIIC
jgi:cell fate regulator YaaT (PSP1 superfamily)